VTPFIIYSAVPKGVAKFRDFFAPGPVWNLVQEPGELRYAGWSLRTLDRARIVRGEYLEVSNGDRKLLNLYEDGTFIAKAAADESFLGWGTQGDAEFAASPRLNPLAVIEFTYSFVDLYARLVREMDPRPTAVQLLIQLKDAWFTENNSSKLYLTPYGVDSYSWRFNDERHEAPEADMIREIDVSADDLADAGAVAYRLVERLYTWFGLSVDKIPYASSRGNRRVIDPTTFARKGGQ
jgi:hypothetical protein